MKAGKTPYEIRSDLLHLAYEVLLRQKEAECAAEQMQNGAEVIIVTKAPTTDEIIDEATKLNGFVSQSTGK